MIVADRASTNVPAPIVLTGPQRVAALLILLGEENGGPIWSQLDEKEVRTVSLAMAQLGAIPGDAVERLMADFASALGSTSALIGSADRVEALLSKLFPAERVAAIMADIRGKSGRDVWRRLGHVPTKALARFLEGEYAQTVAVVLSRIGAEQGGKVLALLPSPLASDVVSRILTLGEIRPEVLGDIEDMLYREFFSGAVRKQETDRYEVMADRFNAFDRATEQRMMAALETMNAEAAARIREKMFTFDDLLKLDAAGCQTLLRGIDKDMLARALKGAKEEMRDFFLSNMSSRASKNLQDDMEALGPLRMKEVDEAQSKLVQQAKALSDSGEIRIVKGRQDEELVV
jgi:flagellar motor switch protein FliG